MKPLHQHSATPHIVVVGSINMDMVTSLKSIPKPGETVHSQSVSYIPGGKGANQAVAAARMNAKVTLIGRVGNDQFALELTQKLADENINTNYILTTSNKSSGIAFVNVDQAGENAIVVSSGANKDLSTNDIAKLEHAIASADVILLQLEVPFETIELAARIAYKHNVLVIFDPAPAPPKPLPTSFYQHVDIICPNQCEAAQLIHADNITDNNITLIAKRLLDLGVQTAIITLGDKGAYFLSRDGKSGFIESPECIAVDTTAAGDSFAGALAVAISQGHSIHKAIQYGCAAGSFAASKHGAQTSIPYRHDLPPLQTNHESQMRCV